MKVADGWLVRKEHPDGISQVTPAWIKSLETATIGILQQRATTASGAPLAKPCPTTVRGVTPTLRESSLFGPEAANLFLRRPVHSGARLAIVATPHGAGGWKAGARARGSR